MPRFPFRPRRAVTIVTVMLMLMISSLCYGDEGSCCADFTSADRYWLISTRQLTPEPCQANLHRPALTVCRLTCDGAQTPSSLDEYLAALDSSRGVVVYIHGNRMDAPNAAPYGLQIHRKVSGHRTRGPIDWVIWSWPSEKRGILIHDARRKADRTDAQGLYVAWLIRHHHRRNVPTTLIGFSFGGRIATGALHALGGGKLAGRGLGGPLVTGAECSAALLAPAIGNDWLSRCGYHSQATKNLGRLAILYNHKDAVLKRYWLLERVRGNSALGYSGPSSFAARADGSKLPVRSRDCATFVGIQHNEFKYYEQPCYAGPEVAKLIDEFQIDR